MVKKFYLNLTVTNVARPGFERKERKRNEREKEGVEEESMIEK